MEMIICKKVSINEGLNSGIITTGAMVFFRNAFFVIPYKSSSVFAGSEAKFNGKAIMDNVYSLQSAGDIKGIVALLSESIPEEHTYYMNGLEFVNVKIGWWIFGGMYVRRHGQQRKAINIQPRSVRIQLKNLYQLT